MDEKRDQLLKIPDEALKTLRSQLDAAKPPNDVRMVGRQKKELIDQETNVDFVGKEEPESALDRGTDQAGGH